MKYRDRVGIMPPGFRAGEGILAICRPIGTGRFGCEVFFVREAEIAGPPQLGAKHREYPLNVIKNATIKISIETNLI
jgi:hypothetical protein